MAAITFSYRSKKEFAPLEARLSFTHNQKRFSFYTRSRIEVTKDFWQDYKKGINFRDTEKANLKADVDSEINNIRKHTLKQFNQAEVSYINKDWFKNTIEDYYRPNQKLKLPEYLLPYFDYYLNFKKNELNVNKRSVQRWKVIRNKIESLQKANNELYKISDINEDFLIKWTDYSKAQNYASDTTKKEFSYIKTVCKHAKTKGINVSPELDSLRIKLSKHQTPKIYLSLSELEKIKAVEGLPPYLENAKDWLLISCFTGQRISDFMRFNKSMLRISKGKHFLDIKQEKTGKDVTVPILPIVLDILEKRNGNFPKPISDQRYNDYIKEVAKRAGLNKLTEGGIRKDNRKVNGKYPKWQLVTSHIGRRSFATNFYGKLPTTFLKDITGHGTEQMLLAYIGKTSKDTAFESYDLLMKAVI